MNIIRFCYSETAVCGKCLMAFLYSLQSCCRKLYSWLKVAPFSSEQYENEDEDWSTAKGIRVLGISYETDK